jgi:hypothetical protein
LGESGEDLAYLSSLSGGSTGAMIYGQINRWDDYLGRSPNTRVLGPMADIPVIAHGPSGIWQTRTRTDGRYEIGGLEIGTFTVTLELPDSLTYTTHPEELQLRSLHACERADFQVHYNGRISGAVLDSSGTPVVGGNVVLTVAELLDDPVGLRRDVSVASDDQGVFEFTQIPPGRYALGLNLSPDLSGMAPARGRKGRWVWPRVFHPGSFEVARATVIELGEGEKRMLSPLRLPPGLIARTVSGRIRWQDGSPVKDAWIVLHDAQTGGRFTGVVHTRDGSFSIAGFADQRVLVRGGARDGETRGTFESSVIHLGLGDVDGLELIVKPSPD